MNEPMSVIAIKITPKGHYLDRLPEDGKTYRKVAIRYPKDNFEIEAEQVQVWDYEHYYPTDEIPNFHPVPQPKPDSVILELYGEPYYVVYVLRRGDDQFGAQYLICRKAPKPAEKKADRVPPLPRDYTTTQRRPIDIPTDVMAQLLLERLEVGNTINDELASDLIRNLGGGGSDE